jgi:hypothetical protein
VDPRVPSLILDTTYELVSGRGLLKDLLKDLYNIEANHTITVLRGQACPVEEVYTQEEPSRFCRVSKPFM